jgi:hypothetical protein
MFLSRRFPVRVRLEPARGRPWDWRANCPHGFTVACLLFTVPPFARGANLTLPWGCNPRCYSGEAVIPERPRLEGANVPPHEQDRFVVDLSACVVLADQERRGTLTGQCGEPLYRGEVT